MGRSPCPRNLAPGLAPGRWQSTLPNGTIQCDLCPRHCRLHDGQRAFCFVRQRRGDQILLTAYGRATGFCIDPIEKKPLNHFYPGTSVLSFGTAGCNLGCKYCQNWTISKARELDTSVDAATPEQVAAAAQREGCTSVAFTYNDPVIFAEYAIDTAHACRALGVKAVAVTNGYISAKAREDFFRPMDAANVDLKAITPRFYQKLCLAELSAVLDTLLYLRHHTDVWLEITALLIPGHNDSAHDVEQLCGWVLDHLGPDVPLHFTAFHPAYRLRGLPRTPPETCQQARARATAMGVAHVYTGNIVDPSGQATYCGQCGAVLIERDWHRIGRYALAGDRCARCHAKVPGRFGQRAPDQTWGCRRQRLAVS